MGTALGVAICPTSPGVTSFIDEGTSSAQPTQPKARSPQTGNPVLRVTNLKKNPSSNDEEQYHDIPPQA